MLECRCSRWATFRSACCAANRRTRRRCSFRCPWRNPKAIALDRRRDIRLAMNVLRGERDHDLSPPARERIAAFRERRSAWAVHARDAGPSRSARDSRGCGLYRRDPANRPARAARRTFIVDAVLALIGRHARDMRAVRSKMRSRCSRASRLRTRTAGRRRRRNGRVRRLDRPHRTAALRSRLRRRCARRIVPAYYVPDAFLFSPYREWYRRRGRRRARRTYGKVHLVLASDEAQPRLRARTSPLARPRHVARRRQRYRERSGRATRGVGAPNSSPNCRRCSAANRCGSHLTLALIELSSPLVAQGDLSRYACR